MAIYSGFSHEKWWFSIAMLVHQRVVLVWRFSTNCFKFGQWWPYGIPWTWPPFSLMDHLITRSAVQSDMVLWHICLSANLGMNSLNSLANYHSSRWTWPYFRGYAAIWTLFLEGWKKRFRKNPHSPGQNCSVVNQVSEWSPSRFNQVSDVGKIIATGLPFNGWWFSPWCEG